jgi:hypothetical protein
VHEPGQHANGVRLPEPSARQRPRSSRWADEVREVVAQASVPKVIPVPAGRWRKFRDAFSWQPALAGAAAAWVLVAAGAVILRPRLDDLRAYHRVAETFVETEAASALVTERQFWSLASTDPIAARYLLAQKLLEAAPPESDRAAFRLTATRVASEVASPRRLATLLPKEGRKGGAYSVFFERVYFDAARKACEQLPASIAGRDELLADFETLRQAVLEVEDLSAWSRSHRAVHGQVEALLRSTATILSRALIRAAPAVWAVGGRVRAPVSSGSACPALPLPCPLLAAMPRLLPRRAEKSNAKIASNRGDTNARGGH